MRGGRPHKTGGSPGSDSQVNGLGIGMSHRGDPCWGCRPQSKGVSIWDHRALPRSRSSTARPSGPTHGSQPKAQAGRHALEGQGNVETLHIICGISKKTLIIAPVIVGLSRCGLWDRKSDRNFSIGTHLISVRGASGHALVIRRSSIDCRAAAPQTRESACGRGRSRGGSRARARVIPWKTTPFAPGGQPRSSAHAARLGAGGLPGSNHNRLSRSV